MVDSPEAMSKKLVELTLYLSNLQNTVVRLQATVENLRIKVQNLEMKILRRN